MEDILKDIFNINYYDEIIYVDESGNVVKIDNTKYLNMNDFKLMHDSFEYEH